MVNMTEILWDLMCHCNVQSKKMKAHTQLLKENLYHMEFPNDDHQFTITLSGPNFFQTQGRLLDIA